MEPKINNSTDIENNLEDGDVFQYLIRFGKLKEAELEQIRKLSTQSSTANFLVRSGIVSDIDMVSAQAHIHNKDLLNDTDFPNIPILESELSLKFLKDALIVPVDEEEGSITVAMADLDDAFSIQAIEMACSKKVKIALATASQIERVLEKLYGDGQSALADIADEINANENNDSLEHLIDLAGEAPIVRLVNMLINRAVETRASDIHIEPFDNRLKVRYRIDGVLQEVEAPPARSTAAIISRIKIMAKLNIAERRLPQDGRIQLRTKGKDIDFRISTVPTLHGESLVLRILDKQEMDLDLNKLGFNQSQSKQLNEILALPHGIILVTGPTGSGKTTTLYGALQRLNTPEKKILTVEDPVEYQLEGINQIQVKPKIGLHFADALRSIVRQDPDIIMIGEMRDLETARIAVQSALTGHLVFTTLHTNDAGSSITRLLDMGVEDYLLTSTLNGILAQRLIRKLCSHCCLPYQPEDELVQELKLDSYSDTKNITLYKAQGCDQCTQTGYHGRTVVTELLVPTEAIRRLILARADGTKIQDEAIANGMDSMMIDGLKKALAGITTIEEVVRVTQS